MGCTFCRRERAPTPPLVTHGRPLGEKLQGWGWESSSLLAGLLDRTRLFSLGGRVLWTLYWQQQIFRIFMVVETCFPGLHLLVKKELNCISWIAFFRSGCEWAWFLSYIFSFCRCSEPLCAAFTWGLFFGRNKISLLKSTWCFPGLSQDWQQAPSELGTVYIFFPKAGEGGPGTEGPLFSGTSVPERRDKRQCQADNVPQSSALTASVPACASGWFRATCSCWLSGRARTCFSFPSRICRCRVLGLFLATGTESLLSHFLETSPILPAGLLAGFLKSDILISSSSCLSLSHPENTRWWAQCSLHCMGSDDPRSTGFSHHQLGWLLLETSRKLSGRGGK